MDKKICPKCKKEKEDVRFMWDLQIDGKQEYCILICKDCDKKLGKR